RAHAGTSAALALVAKEREVTGTLGDEHATVGKKAEAERAVETVRDRLDVERLGRRWMRRARLTQPLGDRRVAVGRGAAVGRRAGHRRGRTRDGANALRADGGAERHRTRTHDED